MTGKREIKCLRCAAPMEFLKRESIQLGEHTYFLGDLSHLLSGALALLYPEQYGCAVSLSGALDVDIYICPECRKVEFFLCEPAEYMDTGMRLSEVVRSKTACPHCGKEYDVRLDACPACGRRPNEKTRR